MKHIYLCLFLLLSLSSHAQSSKLTASQQSAKAAAKKMDEALVKKDYAAFVNTTYPKAVAMTDGGIDKIIGDLKKQMAGIEASGNSIIAAWPGNPSKAIDTAGELQCSVPQFMKMKLSNGILTTQTTLIAISSDKGKTWYFIDVVDRDISKVRELFPNISNRLVLHKSPEPTFVADKNAK